MDLRTLLRSANSTSAKNRVNSPPHVTQRDAAEARVLDGTLGGSGGVRASGGAEPGPGGRVGDESERARLITELTHLIREPSMPESTRTAGLTLIGWLARRMPGEQPHAIGVHEARESERRLKAARQKAR